MAVVELYVSKAVELMPSKRAYLYRAGFKGKSPRLDQKMRDVSNAIFLEGMELACGRVYHAVVPIDKVPVEVIPGEFQGVERLGLFVSSLGERLDERIGEYLTEERVLQATLLDAWGSEAVEALNSSFDEQLRARLGAGTRRFSPGYGDVDIRVNRVVLELLQVAEVQVKESGVLVPRKSTVCMIGFG